MNPFTTDELNALCCVLATHIEDLGTYLRRHAEDHEVPDLERSIAKWEALAEKVESMVAPQGDPG